MSPKVETRKLSSLRAAPYNPRRISDAAMRGLQASVQRFGLVQPIIVNERTGYIVGGHQRAKALQAAGETEALVVLVDLPDTEERALNLALNSPAIAGEFTEGLADLLDEVQAADAALYESLMLGELAQPSPDFEPDEMPAPLDEVSPKFIQCPACGEQFDVREHE